LCDPSIPFHHPFRHHLHPQSDLHELYDRVMTAHQQRLALLQGGASKMGGGGGAACGGRMEAIKKALDKFLREYSSHLSFYFSK
jgi:hypothetical protein